jgi:hypothetical protein
VVGEANKNVRVLGDIVKAKRSGGVLTLKDVMQNPEYLKAENDIIKSMTASPRNLGSVLTGLCWRILIHSKPRRGQG